MPGLALYSMRGGISIDEIHDGIIGGWQILLAREYGIDVG
jgi:hypothetical protein